MVKCFFTLLLLYTQIAVGQTFKQLDGKWAFTGLRTTIFKVANDKIYVAMLEYADTANYNRFVDRLPLDSAVFHEATVSLYNDSIIIDANFPLIDHTLKLLYVPNEPARILYGGDVFFDSTKVIATNNNCNLANPYCVNRLYDQSELGLMAGFKSPQSFTRDDAFEFLLRLNQKLKSRCNRCYAGFTDAYMNEVLFEMSFNPIIKRTAARSVWYNTSGFTFYIKSKFSDDQKILKLSDLIFDWYLKE